MSLVAAIFLIVIIALLASFAVTAGTSKAGATNQAMLADRAVAASHAGAEWGAYRARVANSCVGGAGTTFTINQGALRGFRVTVTCTSTLHEAPANWYVRDITAFAQYGNFGAAEYASHTSQARVSNAP
jgi:hypothetical protein